MKKFKLGFTLIELLIVIALLGTLAVALLAALDPLEQIKKGNDTGVRNTVSEIQSAFLRYYAIKQGTMPFESILIWGAIGTTNSGANATRFSALDSVISSGELKSDFTKLAGDQLNKVFMTGSISENDAKLAVCYAPTSRSFRTDANTKWGNATDGTVTTILTCNPTTGINSNTQTCYWCVQ